MKRVSLITGVAGGIGSATAEVFSEDGWHVVGVDRNKPDTLSGIHRFFQADLSNIRDSEEIFNEVKEKEGHINALINNAAIQICKPLVETTPEEWDSLMAVNVRSVYLAVRNAYPLMRGLKSAIINVSSVHALATSGKIAAYVASKGALLTLTRALAIELATDDIRVNAVLPGAVDTPMLHAGLMRGHLPGTSVEEMVKKLKERTILGRIGKPREIAQAILFLADYKKSSFITGHALVVDGGATAKLSTE
jgi:NAD(P)-dependent dehydrogenase (short-subunit alcohol dehydrogenase family)